MKGDPLPLGLKLLSAFFWFGTAMCLLTIFALIFPDGILTIVWRLKPAARVDFQSLGGWAFLLMGAVGCACSLAAIGLVRRAIWGQTLALVILAVNLAGDCVNAFVRQDARTLIGLPIGGAMICYLLMRRAEFCAHRRATR